MQFITRLERKTYKKVQSQSHFYIPEEPSVEIGE